MMKRKATGPAHSSDVPEKKHEGMMLVLFNDTEQQCLAGHQLRRLRDRPVQLQVIKATHNELSQQINDTCKKLDSGNVKLKYKLAMMLSDFDRYLSKHKMVFSNFIFMDEPGQGANKSQKISLNELIQLFSAWHMLSLYSWVTGHIAVVVKLYDLGVSIQDIINLDPSGRKLAKFECWARYLQNVKVENQISRELQIKAIRESSDAFINFSQNEQTMDFWGKSVLETLVEYTVRPNNALPVLQAVAAELSGLDFDCSSEINNLRLLLCSACQHKALPEKISVSAYAEFGQKLLASILKDVKSMNLLRDVLVAVRNIDTLKALQALENVVGHAALVDRLLFVPSLSDECLQRICYLERGDVLKHFADDAKNELLEIIFTPRNQLTHTSKSLVLQRCLLYAISLDTSESLSSFLHMVTNNELPWGQLSIIFTVASKCKVFPMPMIDEFVLSVGGDSAITEANELLTLAVMFFQQFYTNLDHAKDIKKPQLPIDLVKYKGSVKKYIQLFAKVWPQLCLTETFHLAMPCFIPDNALKFPRLAILVYLYEMINNLHDVTTDTWRCLLDLCCMIPIENLAAITYWLKNIGQYILGNREAGTTFAALNAFSFEVSLAFITENSFELLYLNHRYKQSLACLEQLHPERGYLYLLNDYATYLYTKKEYHREHIDKYIQYLSSGRADADFITGNVCFDAQAVHQFLMSTANDALLEPPVAPPLPVLCLSPQAPEWFSVRDEQMSFSPTPQEEVLRPVSPWYSFEEDEAAPQTTPTQLFSPRFGR